MSRVILGHGGKQLFNSSSTMDFLLLLNLLILASVAIARAASSCETDSSGGYLLRAPEISFITGLQITIGDTNGKSDKQTALVHEYYSNQQQRARLQIYPETNATRAEQQVTFYYDNLIDRRLLRLGQVGGDQTSCEPSDVNNLASGLFGALSKMDKHFSGESWQELGSASVPEHIVGPARILFMIDQRRDQLRGKNSDKVEIRNQEAISYEFAAAGTELEDLRVTVYYANTEQHGAGKDLALRVLLKTKRGDELRADFLQAHEIPPGDFFDHQKELNFFSFPVGLGCSSGFNRFGLAALEWSLSPPDMKVVSYGAKVKEFVNSGSLTSIEYERFVAYDLQAKAVRVDTIQRNGKYSTDIYDLNRNHIYNILQHNNIDHDDDDSRDKSSSSSGKSAKREQQQCIGTVYHKSESYVKFFDFHSMIQMGRATVRGLECMVFEQVTRDLPPTLFPYLNYRNKQGVFFKRAFEQSELALNDSPEAYSVVYYFVSQNFDPSPRLSHRNVALGPLVHVDVYQSNRLRYTFSVNNFVYQLTEAPNGDEQVGLFALRDRCADEGGTSSPANYAELTFEMEYRPQPLSGSSREAAERLGGSTLRNKAIIRALANSMISVTKMYDIESSLELRTTMNEQQQQQQLLIHGTCRLIHTDVESVVPRVIGAADFWSAHAVRTSHEDCFWQAARRRKLAGEGRVLFVACRSLCVIDDSPLITGGQDNSKSAGEPTGQKIESKLFIVSDKFGPDSCAVMLMEEEKEGQATLNPLRIWDEAYRALSGNTVDLSLPDDDDTNLDKKLRFTIDQLEISNDRWSSSLGYELATENGRHSSLKNGQSLNGLGLTRASGRPVTGAQMSNSVCHSLCMASMSCRSFSVCLTGQSVECITSQVNIGDPSLLALIQEKRTEPEAAKKRLIEVNHPVVESQIASGQGSPTDRTLQFRVDIRCKLYKKDPLEMFRLAAPTEVKLRDASMRSVAGPAECAQVCLESNLAFLDKMSNITRQLGIANNNEHKNRMFLREYNSNLALWCSSFRYLNLLDQSGASSEQLAAKIQPDKLSGAGLCSLTQPIMVAAQRRARAEIATNEVQVELQFKQYRFVYSSLYEAHYGCRTATKRQPEDAERVRLWASSAETCARACFLQTSSLKPWCKSFDFIEKPTKMSTAADKLRGGSGATSSYCVLNSLSSADSEPTKQEAEYLLVDSANASACWHYEPKDSFSIDSLAQARAFIFGLDGQDSDNPVANGLQPGALWAFGVVLAALLCSGWLVAIKGEAILDKIVVHGRRPASAASNKRIRFQLPDQIDLAEIHE